MNAKREASLYAQAARTMNCAPDSLTATFVESFEQNAHIYRVDGCGVTYQAFLHCRAGACNWRETPERQASTDLACPAAQLQRTYAGHGTFTVTGCGRAMSYRYHPGNGRLMATPYTAPPAALPPSSAVPPPPPPL